MEKIVELRNLTELGSYLGYAYPEEMRIVAHEDGFWRTDDQGDAYLSLPDINDFLRRFCGGDHVQCVSCSSGFTILERD